MALPGTTFTINDGSLGVSPASSANTSVSLGICSKGVANTFYTMSSPAEAVSLLGYGPLAEAVALKLAIGGGVQYAMPLTALDDGAASAVTKVASGLGLVTVAFAPAETITVVCTTGGNNGTAAFTFKIGSGATSAPVTSVAGATWAYRVPGTMTTLTFTEGTGFDATDTWTISPVQVVTQTVNPGPGNGSLAHTTSQPFDDYDVKVYISTTGAVGAGGFKYSLDGGNTTTDGGTGTGSYGPEITIPSGAKYAIPNTGVWLTFNNNGGSFTAGDLHSFKTIASGYNTTAVTNAYTALYLLSTTWGFAHLVGMASSAANAATAASTVDTQMTTAETKFRFVHTIMECPTSGSIILSGGAPTAAAESNSTVVTAFASFESRRVIVGAGDFLCVSPIDGRKKRRNAAWIAAARECLVPIAENLHRVKRGSLGGFVYSIYHDEANGGLDSGRFLTLRTHLGKPGFYIARGQTMAQLTSDFSRAANRRVMDRACEVVRAAALDYVGDNTIVDATTGYILEREALRIEAEINAKLNAALVATGQASATSVTVKRDENMLSTATLKVTIRVTPLASSDTVQVTIGFTNPAIGTAAAA